MLLHSICGCLLDEVLLHGLYGCILSWALLLSLSPCGVFLLSTRTCPCSNPRCAYPGPNDSRQKASIDTRGHCFKDDTPIRRTGAALLMQRFELFGKRAPLREVLTETASVVENIQQEVTSQLSCAVQAASSPYFKRRLPKRTCRV